MFVFSQIPLAVCFCFRGLRDQTQALLTLSNVPALSYIAALSRFACFLVPTWQKACEFLVPRQSILYTVLSTVYYSFLRSSHSNWDFPIFQQLLTTQMLFPRAFNLHVPPIDNVEYNFLCFRPFFFSVKCYPIPLTILIWLSFSEVLWLFKCFLCLS